MKIECEIKNGERVKMRTRNWKHRLLSLTMCLILVLSLLPSAALADGSGTTSCTVTYKANYTGGTDTAATCAADGSITLADAPARAGYTFTEWNTAADGSGAAYAAGTALTVTANTTLCAQWTGNVHTVTFDMQGHGVAPSKQTVACGSTVKAPVAPAQIGYAFDGWYKEAACTTAWDFSADTMPASDLTLYAKWTAYGYTVKFAAETGGTLGGTTADQSVVYGSSASGCTQTAETGYTFLGWSYNYTGADGQPHAGVVSDYSAVPVYGDMTFTATYVKGSYVSVTATNGLVNIANGAELLDDAPSSPKAAVDSIAAYSASAAIRYARIDDSYEATPTITVIGASIGASNDTETLKEGGNSLANASVNVTNQQQRIIVTSTNNSLAFSVAFAPVSTGYKVLHFRQNADGSYPTAATDTDTYFDVDAGTEASYTPKPYAGCSYDAAKTTWGGTSICASSTVRPVLGNGSLVIKLYYPRNQYTLSYKANGHGTAPTAQTVLCGAAATAPAAPTADGCVFVGWYTDAGLKNAFDFSTPITASTTLYAKWDTAVTISYASADTDKGTVSAASETVCASTGKAVGSTAAAKSGYHFVSWTNAAGAVVSTDAALVPAKTNGLNVAASYTANFAVNAYTVAFNANGGTGTMSSETMTCGAAAALTANTLTRPGYTFTGWNTAPDGSGTGYADKASVSNLTATDKGSVMLYAQWTENTVTISYVSADTAKGTVSAASESLAAATGIAAGSTATAKSGYHFVNWTGKDNTAVSTTAAFIPEKNAGGVYGAAVYTANFAADAVSGGGSGGTSSGGSSAATDTSKTNTDTKTNTDGSTTKTETTTKTDSTGAVTKTETQTTTAKDGTTTKVETATTTKTDTATGAKTETVAETKTAADGTTTKVETVKVAGGKDGITAEAKVETGKNGKAVATALIEAPATATTTTLPAAVVEAVTSADTAKVTVKVGEVSVALDKTAVEAVKATGGESPTLSATPVAAKELPSDLQSATVAYDFKVSGKGVNFGGGSAVVSVPYTKTDSSKAVAVYHVDAAGNETRVYDVTLTAGTLNVSTTGWSTYAVLEVAPLAFTDVSDSNWFYGSVQYVVDNKLFNGTSAATFSPSASMTRQQMWMVLARMAGKTPAAMADARTWAVANKISDGSNPTGAVTREQFVTLLWRAAGSPAATKDMSAYTDFTSVGAYARTAMTWAVENGVVSGTSASTLGAKDSATRAQIAVILTRYSQNTAK